jgi:predicted nucleic acid-binding protein
VLLVDTSAWIDYLRNAPTRAAEAVADLIRADAELATTEPVVMELLAGGDTPQRAAALEQLVNGLPVLCVEPELDFRQAAAIFLAVRRAGRTPRNLVDCLIAATAVRHDVELVHTDADFEAIAVAWPLRARSLR